MANQNNITLYQGHATPKNITLRALPIADVIARKIILYAGHANPKNIILRDFTVPTGGFATQYSGLKFFLLTNKELAMVAEVDAPSGMGGVLKINDTGVVRVVYLVETSDPNASELRIKTTTGIKSLRLKT